MFSQWWVTCVWNFYCFIELKFCFSLTFFFLLFTKKSLKEIMNSPHVFEGCMQISCDLKVKYLLMEQNKARCSAAVLLHDISPQQQRPWSQHVRNKATRWTSEPQQEVRLFVDLWTGNTQQVLISNRVQIQTCVYQHLYIWAHRELSWTHTSVLHQTQHTYTLFPPAAAQSSLYSQGGLLIWKAPHRKFQRNRRRTKGWSVMLRLVWSASAGQRWKVTNYIYLRYCNWVVFLCICTF